MALPSLVLSVVLCGNTLAPPPPQPSAAEQHTAVARYHRTQWIGGTVLGAWAVTNIATGLTGALVIDDERRFFHQMNAMWNTVNLSLALVSIIRHARRPTQLDRDTTVREAYRQSSRVYAINGALDILYIGAGAITAALGHHYGQTRARGYGTSIAFQGLFLLGFDLAMLLANAPPPQWRSLERSRPRAARMGALEALPVHPR